MAPPHAIDTKNPAAVAQAVTQCFAGMGAPGSGPLLERLISGVTRLFAGEHAGLLPIDMFYHNYEHTLQATVCAVHMLVGRHRAQTAPVLSARDGELTVMAALMHDTGFLKRTDDRQGTGAKYTFVHERRSADLARSFLPPFGVAPAELDDIATAIGCTGPANRISGATFRRPEARLIACVLVTADYLSQMSAPDYVDKLPVLYREFVEAYDFEELPADKRLFHSFRDLMERSPAFWEKFVRPMLDTEMGGLYRFLETTGQANPYLQAIEDNVSEVRRRVQAGLVNV
ncbi:MAG: HD domain-containing protein, partial [Opitutae bacterium]|nr:HD domain-containing protein [Opitutae bacterium]